MESGQLDLAAKAAYLKELNRTDPGAVLRHMEQQPQLASEAVAAEYIRALVKSGRSASCILLLLFPSCCPLAVVAEYIHVLVKSGRSGYVCLRSLSPDLFLRCSSSGLTVLPVKGISPM